MLCLPIILAPLPYYPCCHNPTSSPVAPRQGRQDQNFWSRKEKKMPTVSGFSIHNRETKKDPLFFFSRMDWEKSIAAPWEYPLQQVWKSNVKLLWNRFDWTELKLRGISKGQCVWAATFRNLQRSPVKRQTCLKNWGTVRWMRYILFHAFLLP